MNMNNEQKTNNELCTCCGTKDNFVMIEKFKAFACKTCNVWIEPICDSLSCAFCRKRTPKPFE